MEISETTTTYSCDLCGKDSAKDALTRVSNPYFDPDAPQGLSQVDICRQCEATPISELLALLCSR